MMAAAGHRQGRNGQGGAGEGTAVRCGYKGVGNTYTYADKGDGGESVAIVQIENGKLKLTATGE